jgi:EAL domain-containing protein (putative c-di-GMP-specific phosphodiesterase class I)
LYRGPATTTRVCRSEGGAGAAASAAAALPAPRSKVKLIKIMASLIVLFSWWHNVSATGGLRNDSFVGSCWGKAMRDNTMRAAGGRERRSPRAHDLRERASVRRLKEALDGERLTLEYQPILRAADLRPVAAEALLRWREPERETHSLPELLLAAERSPVIFALEAWAMSVCFRDAAAWQSGPLPGLRINLNLSAREFHHGRNLVPRVERAAAEAGIDARKVTLEITETSAIHAPEHVARVIERLKALGLELWLDDFGTGHSSLAWLSWFPIDGLKVPGLFVERLPADRRSAVITADVIDMAHRLGLRVVAEGIETDGQASWLKEHGADAVQGFLFAAPLPPNEMVARLTSA